MGDFPYTEWLTRKYKQRAETTHPCNWVYYIKAHGLANFSLTKDRTDQRRQLVYDIEKSWYNVQTPPSEHPLTYTEYQELTKKHKKLLENYRKETRTDFNKLQIESKKLKCETIFNCQKTLNQVHSFSKHILKASKYSSQRFVKVSESIVKSSVDNLNQVNMLAPCKFAVVALGSVAKGEATPYSDVEYAFIVEKDSEYFTKLAMESYFRIGNMGESPLKTFNIEELKEREGVPSTITDNNPVGYRIDGIGKHAGNIPTGNGLDGAQPLTFTVENLMQLYKSEAESPFTGLADKSDMLSSTTLIYSNKGGTSQLHQDFLKARAKYEKDEARHSTRVAKRRVDLFTNDLKEYTFIPEFVKYQPPKNQDVEIKTDIFRYPTLFSNNIKMCLGLELCYSWDIFADLRKQNMLSEKLYRYMIIVLALSIYLRTSAYLHQQSQVKHVSLSPNIAGPTTGCLYYVSPDLFVILGSLLAPIKQSIDIDQLAADNIDTESFAKSIINQIAVDQSDFMVMVEVCYFSGQYKLAKSKLSQGIGHSLDETSCTQVLKELESYNKNVTTKKKHAELCAYLLYHTSDYRSAVDYFQWLIINGNSAVRFWKLLTAHCRQEMGDYISCRRLLDEVRVD